MKKFMKGCAITALIMVVVGLVIAIIAGTSKGCSTISEVVDSVTGGRIQVNLDDISDFGVTVGDNIKEGLDSVEGMNYTIDASTLFDKHYDILSGDIERYSVGSDFENLDIEMGACRLTTKPSPDSNFYLEAEDAQKFQGYVKDGTLYVRASVNGHKWNGTGCRIFLYVPSGAYFENIDIEVGAGVLNFDDLYAEEAAVEVGAGEITLNGVRTDELAVSVGMGQVKIDEMETNNLDIEVGMGTLTAEGSINAYADIECAMGNVSLKVEGSQKDFNYEISKAMGNLTLGTESGSSFASEKYIDNCAFKDMDVECSMGNVSIQFTE